MKKYISIVFIVLTIIYTGCSNNSEKKEEIVEKSIITTKYSILEDKNKRDIKRRVIVLLDVKPSNKELKAIAFKILKSDNTSYLRTFIGYYIKNTNQDYGYWATTNFNPTLEIIILGLTSKDENFLLKNNNPNREILGAYISAILARKLTFFLKDKVMFMELYYCDGSNDIKEMKYVKTNSNFKIEEIDNSYGEYFILTDGELQLWDTKGKLYTTKRIY